MTTKNNKSIILLYPPYGPESHELNKNITNSCKLYNLSIIKFLQAKEPFDSIALIKLIKTVTAWRRRWPINLIIDRALCNSPDYILAIIVLDILSTTGLIKLYYYERNAEDINSNEVSFNFLPLHKVASSSKPPNI